MLRADLHVHTRFSPDCLVSLRDIVRRCQQVGINCLAITDHGTIEGALGLREIAPFPVIIGQEIYTQAGEMMAFFLTSAVPAGLPVEEAVARIRDQGGVVGIPHPFDWLLRSRGRELIHSLLPGLQTIEVFNARSLKGNDSALRFAQEHNLLTTAGSDAHTLYEIGNAYVEMPEFEGREGFLCSLAQGKVVGHRSPMWVHFLSAWVRFRRGI